MLYTEEKYKNDIIFLVETIQARRQLSNISKVQKEKNQKPDNIEISTQQKCSYKKGKMKMFSEIQKQKQIISNIENRKKILKEALLHRSVMIPVGNLNPHRVKSTKNDNYKN